ncbi:MAG TPA: D-2-hydroxyacid dehydrogenase [Terrimicrobiaceae bacterium]
MTSLKILSDMPLDEPTLTMLRTGLAPSELVLPEQPVASVLATAPYSIEGIDIAFGQPDPTGVLASKTLRWVHLTSAGYTRFDTPDFRTAAVERGLILTNSSSVYDEPCAEHVFAFMLAAARQLPGALHVRCESGSEEWNRLRSNCRILHEQSIVILGFGAIAKHLLKLLAPFAARVTAFRRRARGDEEVPVVTLAELPKGLSSADHVVNILPDNADSRHFINADRLGQIRPGAILYNIGRGTTVDQAALAGALRSGHLAAAWLDVTDPEPLPVGHPLLDLENCHITPHIAGGHRNEPETLVQHFLGNFRRFLDGSPLRDRVL